MSVALPKINPSPKARFLGIKHCVDAHRDLMQRQDLITGVEQAMLEYIWGLCGRDQSTSLQPQAGEAAANYYKILGAHEYVRTLRTLAEATPAPPAKDTSMDFGQTFK